MVWSFVGKKANRSQLTSKLDCRPVANNGFKEYMLISTCLVLAFAVYWWLAFFKLFFSSAWQVKPLFTSLEALSEEVFSKCNVSILVPLTVCCKQSLGSIWLAVSVHALSPAADETCSSIQGLSYLASDNQTSLQSCFYISTILLKPRLCFHWHL